MDVKLLHEKNENKKHNFAHAGLTKPWLRRWGETLLVCNVMVHLHSHLFSSLTVNSHSLHEKVKLLQVKTVKQQWLHAINKPPQSAGLFIGLRSQVCSVLKLKHISLVLLHLSWPPVRNVSQLCMWFLSGWHNHIKLRKPPKQLCVFSQDQKPVN